MKVEWMASLGDAEIWWSVDTVSPSIFLWAERTLCRCHSEHILNSGDPQGSTLLICSTHLKRQRAPVSQAWLSEEPVWDPQCSILLSLSVDFYMNVKLVGSPKMGASSNVFLRGCPQKQGEYCMSRIFAGVMKLLPTSIFYSSVVCCARTKIW